MTTQGSGERAAMVEDRQVVEPMDMEISRCVGTLY